MIGIWAVRASERTALRVCQPSRMGMARSVTMQVGCNGVKHFETLVAVVRHEHFNAVVPQHIRDNLLIVISIFDNDDFPVNQNH